MRRLLVCGGRDYRDGAQMEKTIQAAEAAFGYEVTLVHGSSRGADMLADQIVRKRGRWEIEPHPADWSVGRAAGPLRNQEMIDSGVDFALVFPGGKGTLDMMVRLFDAGIPFRFVGEVAPR